jgi:hypothetical protein
VVGGDALVVELYMRIFSFSNSNGVVVFQDGAIGRLIVWFFELELDDSLVDVLNSANCTFFMIKTLNYTSYDSCTNC